MKKLQKINNGKVPTPLATPHKTNVFDFASLGKKLLPTFFDSDFQQSQKKNVDILTALKEKIELEAQQMHEKKLQELKKGAVYKNSELQQLKPYNAQTVYSPFKNPKLWWEQRQISQQLSKRFFVNMQLENGDFDSFYVLTQSESFVWNEKRYVLDQSAMYYNIASSCYASDYHENFSLPIIRSIPINALRKGVERTQEFSVVNTTNPANLEKFVKSDVIAKVISGAQMEELIKKIQLYLIIIMVMVGIVILLNLKIAGILKF